MKKKNEKKYVIVPQKFHPTQIGELSMFCVIIKENVLDDLFEYIVKIYNSLYEPNVIRQIEKYFAYFIKNYTLLSNFDSLIRATYDICPSTNNDDDEINNISFPEVLENIEKEKDKVDLALENSKIFK